MQHWLPCWASLWGHPQQAGRCLLLLLLCLAASRRLLLVFSYQHTVRQSVAVPVTGTSIAYSSPVPSTAE